jgi:hypothetical protein
LASLIVLFGQSIRLQQDNERLATLACLTPFGYVSAAGTVVDSSTHHPIPDAEIILKNLSPDQSQCADVTYLATERIKSDDTGRFIAVGNVTQSQVLDITIIKSGCQTYHAPFFLALEFIQDNPKDSNGPLFSLQCND